MNETCYSKQVDCWNEYELVNPTQNVRYENNQSEFNRKINKNKRMTIILSSINFAILVLLAGAIVFGYNNLQQFKLENNKLLDEQMKMNETLQIFVDKIKELKEEVSNLPPFPLPPTEKMNEKMKVFKLLGFSPVFSDKWGHYPPMDLLNLGQESSWKNALKKNSSFSVNWNPLMLPTELGGWTVAVFIKWNKNQLNVYSGLCHNDERNNGAPEDLSVRLQVKILLSGFPSFETDRIFKLMKNNDNSYNLLWTISKTVNEEWPVPVVNIQVKKP